MIGEPWQIAIAAWLFPGAGHWKTGQRWRGAAFAVAVTLTYALGWAATDGHAVSTEVHPLAFAAQLFAGLPTAAALALNHARTPSAAAATVFGAPVTPGPIVAWIDLGLVFTMTAGLLNLLLAIDAFERALKARERSAP